MIHRMNRRIHIIDYGMGNLKSIINSLNYLGYENITVDDSETNIQKSDFLILPGVGAFDQAMHNLESRGLIDPLNDSVIKQKKPILAICLGMQLIMQSSEEGETRNGLCWLDGNVELLTPDNNLRIPHVGWNNLNIANKTYLFDGMGQSPDFYFVHSYHVLCDASLTLATCNYGYDFNAALNYENIFAFQFHPEKSQKNGLKLIDNILSNTL
ncbi:MAG: imidazole glycerol phosphate synthase subunit HisH [Legionellales bacterium]|nr:imidazole glycerol phosphate synthase subunit HisH [Legionellales bacterium]